MFDDAPIDQAVEGIVNGIFFNQGHVCCAGSRLLVQESIADEVLDRLKRRLGTLRVGDPLDKNTDIGAINSAEQLERITELVDAGDAEGAERWQPACELPDARASGSRRRSSPTWPRRTASPARRSSGRCCRCSRSARRTRRSRRPTTRRTACRPASGPRRARASSWMAERLRAGVVWANTFNRFDPTVAVRRLQGVGLRPRGRPARPRRLPRPESERRADDDRARRPQDLQALRRRQVPALGVAAASYEVTDAKGRFLANAAHASRKDARDAVVAARGAFAGWSGATAYNRGQVLYRVAEMLEGRRDAVRRRGRRRRGRSRPCRGRAGRRRHRPLGLVRRLDRQVRPGRRRRQPGRRARTSTSRCPSRPAWSPSSRPQESSLLGLVSVVAPVIVERQHRASSWPRESRPLPAVTLAEVLATSDLPGGVVNVLTGHVGRARRRGWPRTWTSTRIDLTGVGDRRARARPRDRGGRERQAGAARARAPSPTGPPTPDPRPHPRLHRDEDRLAPDRRLISGRQARPLRETPRDLRGRAYAA